MNKQIKISVVIPVFNEVNTIAEIIKRVKGVELNKEIIVVDDCSSDGTRQYLEGLKDNEVRVFLHEKNQGKGAALRTGFQHITGDIVIVQDADLEYDPNDYHKLIKPIVEGKADVVYGSRFLGGEYVRVLFFWHMVVNKFITSISNMFTNLNLTDIEVGYKVFASYVIKNLKIRSNRFGFDPEITAKVAKMRYRIFEAPISYYGRDYLAGKKIGWKDAIIVLGTIIKYFFVFDAVSGNVGYRLLYKIGRLRQYNRWIYKEIEPSLGKRILEVGSGMRNMSMLFLKKDLLIATDFEEQYLIYLRNLLPEWDRVKVRYLDINNINTNEWRDYRIDTVACINVLEYVQKDQEVLKGLFDILEPGGRLVLLVPALKALYGNTDKNLGHYRRYDIKEVANKLTTAGFSIERASYFNFLGAFGWFINNEIFRRKELPSIQLTIFDFLVPVLRLEKFFKIPLGQSIIAVGRK